MSFELGGPIRPADLDVWDRPSSTLSTLPTQDSDRRAHRAARGQGAQSSGSLEICADALDEDVSPAQQEIFDLYYGQNRSTKLIAQELGKSNQAIKISLFRTRRAMEARLEERGMALIA
jgi:DNA-directed RNA polymerase specialized sigma24 family protein